MTINVNTENIPLAPESQERIETLLRRLNQHLSESASLRVFIKPSSVEQEAFTVLIHVHDHHHDFITEHKGPSVLHVAREAVNQIRQRLIKSKDKYVRGRNKSVELPKSAS